MSTKFLAIAAFLISLNAWADDTQVPNGDLPGLSDPQNFKRIQASILIARDAVDYDEVTLPAGPIKTDDNGTDRASKTLPMASGVRNRLIYLLPAGRSTLEAVRSYQSELATLGFKTLWECEGDSCGASSISDYSMLIQIWPASAWAYEDSSAASCAKGGSLVEQRYAAMSNSETGAVVGLVSWRPDVNSVYCEDGAFQKRAAIAVTYVAPKAREQNMQLVSASEMETAIARTGRVALYGIFFDTASATLKSESKAALDEIGILLKAQPAMKLHVVGHTDDQGGLEANFDLSKRRAAAVREALIKNYTIDGNRLTANGVSYLAPVASNKDDVGRAKNRRVELVPM